MSKDGGLIGTHNQEKKLRSLRAIEFLKDTFYASTPTAVWHSADGAAWSQVNTQLHGARAFAYNEKTDTLFAVAHAISRSPDGGNTREQVFDLKPYHGGEANIMSITCFEDYVVCTGADMLILISKDNGTTWSQLSQCPSKGGFLGLLQTEERIFGIGTFQKIAP